MIDAIELPSYATAAQRAVVDRLLAENPGSQILAFAAGPATPSGRRLFVEVGVYGRGGRSDDRPGPTSVQIGVRGGTRVVSSPETRAAKRERARAAAEARRERADDGRGAIVSRGGRLYLRMGR